QRVQVRWPVLGDVTPYEHLSDRLREERQALAVVHLRRDARALAELLPAEGRFHLSGLMCPAHRLDVFPPMRGALKEGRTCRAVTTQLVEAGVDIDFPVVFRALAGFASLVQAAGRCNREGRLVNESGQPRLGRFEVFRAPTSPPTELRRSLEAMETLLARHE